MSCQRFLPRAVLVFACVFGVSGPAMAEHAETVLKYNPGQPGHTNVYDTYIAASNPTTNYNGLWYGHITRKKPRTREEHAGAVRSAQLGLRSLGDDPQREARAVGLSTV